MLTFQTHQIPAALSGCVIRLLAMAPGSLKSALIKGSSERSTGRASQNKSKLMDHREPLVDGNVKYPSLLLKKRPELSVSAMITS